MNNELHLDSKSYISQISNQGSFISINIRNILINAIDAYLHHRIFPPVSHELFRKLSVTPFTTFLNEEKITFKTMQVDVLRLTVVQDRKWKTKEPPYLFINDERVVYKLLLINNHTIQGQFIRDGKEFYWMNILGKAPVPIKKIIGWDFIDKAK